MPNDTTTPTRPPAWLHLDEVIAPETRRRLEEHQRSVAEAIMGVRTVFADAQADLQAADAEIGSLPDPGFDWIMANTVVGDLDKLLRAFAGAIAPDDTMSGDGSELDAELAKVPGLDR